MEHHSERLMRSIGDATAYTAYQDEAAQGLALKDAGCSRKGQSIREKARQLGLSATATARVCGMKS